MRKRIMATIMALVLVFGMTGYVYAGTSSSKKQTSSDSGKKNAKKSTKKNKKKSTKKNSKKSAKKNTKKKSENTSEAEQSKTGNPLLDAEMHVGDVMNGTRTEKLGEYAYISVPLVTMQNVTMEQYAEFCNQRVEDSGYNWVTINFRDGTGLQFAGSTPIVATYGTLDNEQCIEEQRGTVMLTGEDTYEYSENQ